MINISSLADRIIEHGRAVAGDAVPPWWLHASAQDFNRLRIELIGGRQAIEDLHDLRQDQIEQQKRS